MSVRRLTLVAVMMGLVSLLSACAPDRLLSDRPIVTLPAQTFGLTCPTAHLCVEHPETFETADRLYREAVAFVHSEIGPTARTPRAFFCTTQACFDQFRGAGTSGLYIWGAETVIIGPQGWRDFILRHEMIHHWQAQSFGRFRAARGLPRWYIEGMAYTLSQDPRRPIPNAIAEAHRTEFDAWVALGNDWRVPPQ